LEKTAEPRDIWFFRYIDDASYTQKASILTVLLPEAKKPSTPFDPKAKKRYRKMQKAINKLKKKAVSRLLSLKPESAPFTDIYGAVIRASEILSNYKDHRKFLILATDLKDNLHRKGTASLENITVIIILFEADSDPLRTQQRVNKWREYFIQNKAKQVVIITPSEPLSQVEEILLQK
jgi:hypothetical protein